MNEEEENTLPDIVKGGFVKEKEDRGGRHRFYCYKLLLVLRVANTQPLSLYLVNTFCLCKILEGNTIHCGTK